MRLPEAPPGRGNDKDDFAWLLLKAKGWIFGLLVFAAIVGGAYFVLLRTSPGMAP